MLELRSGGPSMITVVSEQRGVKGRRQERTMEMFNINGVFEVRRRRGERWTLEVARGGLASHVTQHLAFWDKRPRRWAGDRQRLGLASLGDTNPHLVDSMASGAYIALVICIFTIVPNNYPCLWPITA